MDEEQTQMLESILECQGSSLRLTFGDKQYSVSYDAHVFEKDPEAFILGHITMYDCVQEVVSQELVDISGRLEKLLPLFKVVALGVNQLVPLIRKMTGGKDISAERALQLANAMFGEGVDQEIISSTLESVVLNPEVLEALKEKKDYFGRAGAIFGFGAHFFESQYAQRHELPTCTVSLLRQCQQKAQAVSETCTEVSSMYGQITSLYQANILVLAHMDGTAPTE